MDNNRRWMPFAELSDTGATQEVWRMSAAAHTTSTEVYCVIQGECADVRLVYLGSR